ncbi:MAG: AlkZ family DNA glycosylase [Saprospiraceae bacterium]|nr:AlkZ family DNA glycosylase [Saprospiraceae bacterium]
MNVTRQRLLHQQLCGSGLRSAHELVRWFGAVQGQEYGPTKWGLGLRLPHLNEPDIEQELSAGRLLRTHLLRPTWHLVAAEDIRWLLQLTAPRVQQINAHMYRKLNLDAALFQQCNQIIGKRLEGNRHCTREELADALRCEGLVFDGQAMVCVMMQAELEGLVCSGARCGLQFTYALLEERVPAAPEKSREEALQELSRRYFLSRGPATAYDFATWSGLTITDCKKAIAAWQPDLLRERIGEADFFHFAETAPATQPAETLLLLPIYDEFIMGYKDKSHILEFNGGIRPAADLRYTNMIVFDGQIIGSWRRDIRAKAIDVEYHFCRTAEAGHQALLEQALRRFEAFNGLPVQVKT